MHVHRTLCVCVCGWVCVNFVHKQHRSRSNLPESCICQIKSAFTYSLIFSNFSQYGVCVCVSLCLLLRHRLFSLHGLTLNRPTAYLPLRNDRMCNVRRLLLLSISPFLNVFHFIFNIVFYFAFYFSRLFDLAYLCLEWCESEEGVNFMCHFIYTKAKKRRQRKNKQVCEWTAQGWWRWIFIRIPQEQSEERKKNQSRAHFFIVPKSKRCCCNFRRIQCVFPIPAVVVFW